MSYPDHLLSFFAAAAIIGGFTLLVVAIVAFPRVKDGSLLFYFHYMMIPMLFAYYLALLIGLGTTNHTTTCRAFGTLAHLFLTSVICWMGFQGFEGICVVLKSSSVPIHDSFAARVFYFILSLAVPLTFVGFTQISSADVYRGSEYCWIQSSTVVLTCVFLPLMVAVILNLSFFLLAFRRIYLLEEKSPVPYVGVFLLMFLFLSGIVIMVSLINPTHPQNSIELQYIVGVLMILHGLAVVYVFLVREIGLKPAGGVAPQPAYNSELETLAVSKDFVPEPLESRHGGWMEEAPTPRRPSSRRSSREYDFADPLPQRILEGEDEEKEKEDLERRDSSVLLRGFESFSTPPTPHSPTVTFAPSSNSPESARPETLPTSSSAYPPGSSSGSRKASVRRISQIREDEVTSFLTPDSSGLNQPDQDSPLLPHKSLGPSLTASDSKLLTMAPNGSLISPPKSKPNTYIPNIASLRRPQRPSDSLPRRLSLPVMEPFDQRSTPSPPVEVDKRLNFKKNFSDPGVLPSHLSNTEKARDSLSVPLEKTFRPSSPVSSSISSSSSPRPELSRVFNEDAVTIQVPSSESPLVRTLADPYSSLTTPTSLPKPQRLLENGDASHLSLLVAPVISTPSSSTPGTPSLSTPKGGRSPSSKKRPNQLAIYRLEYPSISIEEPPFDAVGMKANRERRRANLERTLARLETLLNEPDASLLSDLSNNIARSFSSRARDK